MDYKIIERENINYITVPKLEELGVKNMFTMDKIDFKLPNPLDEEKRKKTFDICFDEMDIEPKNIFTSRQIHSKKVVSIENDKNYDRLKYWNRYPDCDGLITNTSKTLLLTKYADCLPIVLFDTQNRVIANVHSGWRGTLQKIVLEAIDQMINYYNSDPKNIIAILGPAIGYKDFEVTKEVYEEFHKQFNYDNIIKQKDETHWLIDTRKINKNLLKEAKILAENIISIDISTVSDKRFHSYRRDGKNYKLMGALTYLE
ncbi:MAG: peptidoglycan editing factor PgeF [Tissierellia bacterium]|nr:peptidoglycan editing factor PgeF [Tissierellia bacterium]